MPQDRSTAHTPENGNSGRIKLVLRLDKDKGKSVEEPPSDARPKRTPNSKASLDDYIYASDKKIPKLKKDPEVEAAKEPSPPPPPVIEEHRPTRKRKPTTDSDFVFEPLNSREEDDFKKPKRKTPRKDNSEDAYAYEVATPPQYDQDANSGIKLKLKFSNPATPEGAHDGKRRRRQGEEVVEEIEADVPHSSGLKMKFNQSPADKKSDVGFGLVFAKPKDLNTTPPKRPSPPRRESERNEPKVESRDRNKPSPEKAPSAPLTEDAIKMRKICSGILPQLVKLDRQMYFMEPVTEDIAPQYFTIIARPMDFKTMRKKVKDGVYDSVDTLKEDFQLICNNCMAYNPPKSIYHLEAKRVLTQGIRIIEKHLDGLATTTEHKLDSKDKTPSRHTTPTSTPTKSMTKPSTPGSVSASSHRTPATPTNNGALGVAFPITSGQLSSTQFPIATTPQHRPYPNTPTTIMSKPPAYPPPPISPYNTRMPATSTMRPNPSPMIKSQSTPSMFPPRPNALPNTPLSNTPARPPPPGGKPGARPPVVTMSESQATQTQAMYPEQPKRKYVKPQDEPVKPVPTPQMKTPAKHVAKVGTTPLVTPANVPGSFVYSMYIPRFELNTLSAEKSSTETATPASPPMSPPTTSTTTTTSTTVTSPPSVTSPPPMGPPTTTNANGGMSINLASTNYISNFVSVPSLYNKQPSASPQDASDAWLHPPRKVIENTEPIEEIAQDCLLALDAGSRTQMLDFFTSLAQNTAQGLVFPKCAMQPIRPIQKQTKPISTTSTTPSSSSNLVLDPDLLEQIEKLDSFEVTAQDLASLQGMNLDIDLLSSLLSTPLPSSSTTPATETTTSTAQESPPTDMDITATPMTEVAHASRLVQDILDKNLEHLWSLQIMQHERITSNPSEAEVKLASHICDGLYLLGTSVPPFMLATKEAVSIAIEQTGLVPARRFTHV